MFDFDYFNGKDLEYPKRPSKPRLDYSNHESASARKYAADHEKYEDEMIIFREEVHEYAQAQLDKEFGEALKKEFGPMTDEQFGVVWYHAWEQGHSEGLYRVAEIFEEYTEMCKEFMRHQK